VAAASFIYFTEGFLAYQRLLEQAICLYYIYPLLKTWIMHFKKAWILSVLLAIIFLFQQCSKKDVAAAADTTLTPKLPATAYNYTPAYPAFIQTALNLTDNTPADNAINNDGATLGRVLFYDKQLSKNNTVSCGSCHKPETSFSDEAVLSKGFNAGLTSRHSMALVNVRFYKSGKMFWDERSPTLEKQVLQPIQNTVEMGLTLSELENKVKSLSYYPALFQKAFGSTQIDSVKIAKAVAQFIRSIVTFQSKYDQVKQGLATFTPDEAAGEQLFLSGAANSCGGCHRPPMFTTPAPVVPFAFPDPGDAGINNENRFKSGSLRNIALTAPYFHNGKVLTLTAMLNGGPVGSPTHVPAHSVAPQDASKILAFLQTLTDNSITTELRFADPFK
jgi:cytochrome c peroxidase